MFNCFRNEAKKQDMPDGERYIRSETYDSSIRDARAEITKIKPLLLRNTIL